VERKDAPILVQLRHAASDVEDVDHVVRPFVPNADVANQASKTLCVSSADQSESSSSRPKLSHKHFSLARRISLVLGVVLGISLCAIMWRQRQADEEQFRYYSDQAELAEYSAPRTSSFNQRELSQLDKAAFFWRKAIKVSESLHAERRCVADLHMRAAIAECRASDVLELGVLKQEITREMLTRCKADEKEDLLTALHIYQHDANARAEQMMALNKLILLTYTQVPHCRQAAPYRDLYCNRAPTITDSFPGLPILDRPDKNDIDKTVANYRNYVIREGDTIPLSENMKSLIGLLQTPQQYEKAIPLLHEYVYHTVWPEHFLDGHKWLEEAIEKSGRSKDSTGRLTLANDAYARGDLHGAIVEYSRYLADNENDDRIREKLLALRRLNRQKNIGSGPDQLLELISFSKQLQRLQGEAFGYDSSEAISTTLDLAREYSAAEDTQSAEKELAPLLKKVKERIPSKQTHPFNQTLTGSTFYTAADPRYDPASEIFGTSAEIATQKAMYESAMRDLERSASLES